MSALCSTENSREAQAPGSLWKLPYSKRANGKVEALSETMTSPVWGLELMMGEGKGTWSLELSRLRALGRTATVQDPGPTLAAQ